MVTSRTTNSQPGQCYPRETLVGLLHLCASKGIHLISDEIYALSVYSRYDREPEKFTSIRAIDPAGIIDPNQVHVLYGMSKVSNLSLVSIKFKVLMRSPGLRCKRDAVRLHYIPKSRLYKGHACCLVSDLYRFFPNGCSYLSISRFSSPSQFSMHLAAKLLEDQTFVLQFIEKSHRLLLQNRLLAEDLLARAGINYHQEGYVTLHVKLRPRLIS